MALTTHADVRQRVAEAIDDALGADGWTESPFAFDAFFQPDSRLLRHLGYSVGLGQTVPAQLDRQRRSSVGALVQTTVRVRWSHQLRVDGQVTDYDAALAAELNLLRAVLAIDRDPDLSIRLERISVREAAPELLHFVGQLDFVASHLLDLSIPPPPP